MFGGNERLTVKYSLRVLLLAVVVLAASQASMLICASVSASGVGQSQFAPGGQPAFYDYHDYMGVVATLDAIESDHSSIAEVYDIGDSWETTVGEANRDILAVKISDNPGLEEDEPEVLIIARLHANEAPPTEIALEFAEDLTDLYGVDTRVSWLVDNREIWIIPAANPDGMDYAMTVDDTWRKNRRLNWDGTYGVDLNRNFDGSQDGSILGAWGGVGTSDIPSSLIYCGEYAFSEPETQAIRDLVLCHDFQLAIDFHWAANWVMWPWGYTTDLPPDNDDLVRIGTELSEVTGYYASQSSIMYPTAGDSCDWLYGGEDVYSYCVEVGGWWSPGEIMQDLPNNVAAAMLLAEIAGDREEAQFDIEHEPLTNALYTSVGFEVSADITASRGVTPGDASVVYRADGGEWSEVLMVNSAGTDTYSALIPPQAEGSRIDYYLKAHDLAGVELMSPRYAPYEAYSFEVLPDTEPPAADAGTDIKTFVDDEVVFDGSGSDDNAGIVSYVWSFVYGEITVELLGVSPSFTFLIAGAYEVTLTVTDFSDNVGSDTVVVTVMDPGE